MTYAYFVLVDNADSAPFAYMVTSPESDFFEIRDTVSMSLGLRDVSPRPETLRLAMHKLSHHQSINQLESWKLLQNYRDNMLRVLNSHRYSNQTWHLYDPFTGVKDLKLP